MVLPLTVSDPRVRVPESALPPMSAEATVREVDDRLAAIGDQAIVLWRDRHPVSVITRATVREAMHAGLADEPAHGVADHVVVRVDPQADDLGTLRAFRRAAWRWMRGDRGR